MALVPNEKLTELILPTARNRLGAHGQGSEIIEIPEHIAGYVLHQTASSIVFIVQAEMALP